MTVNMSVSRITGSKQLMSGFTVPLIKLSSSAQVQSAHGLDCTNITKKRRISNIKRAEVHFGVIYLREVILPVYQLFNDVEVVSVGHILHGHIQSRCHQSL